MALSCIVCLSGRKSRNFFILHLYLKPRKGWPRRNFTKMFDSHRTKMIGYRAVKKLWRYVKPFRYNTGTWRTDGRTDDQTENSYINIQLTRRAVKTGWLQKLPMPRPRNHVRFTSLASGHCLLSAVCYLIATVYLFDYLACQQLAVFIAKHVCSRTNCALPGQPISSANNQSINSATNLQNYSRKLAELFFFTKELVAVNRMTAIRSYYK